MAEPPAKCARLERGAEATLLESAGLPAAAALPDVEDIWKLHEEACARKEDFYTDPASGYQVFTRHAHLKRGKCCGSGCRHCPFNHERVQPGKRALKSQQPCFLHLAKADEGDGAKEAAVVLAWSTGKDSYLTLRKLRREGKAVVLVTTFDGASRTIANQETNIADAVRQAQHLDVSLVGVPLLPGLPYAERLKAGLDVVRAKRPVRALAFGDLHLEHVRSWREDVLRPEAMGVEELLYPLWGTPYEELLRELEESKVRCSVSATGKHFGDEPAWTGLLAVGQPFDRELSRRLEAAGCDAFGERGEFHTLAMVWDCEDRR